MATNISKQTTNNSGSGYCKMPDGTLVQYGTTQIPANAAKVNINFPISFINYNYGISVAFNYSYANNVISSYAAKGKNSIDIHRNATNTNSEPFSWLAIGRWKE